MTTILSKPRNNIIAKEMIDFQNNSFGIQIEAIISKISTALENKVYTDTKALEESPELKNLVDTIFDRLGIKVKIVTGSMVAGILPFYSNKHHIFINKFFRGNFTIAGQEKILKQSLNKEGYVDLKKAKVGGIFSQYEHIMYINFYELILTFKLSPAEITAIILHELGHAFAACSYSDRVDTVNQVLANIAKELTGKKEKDLVYIYKELHSVNEDITEADVDTIVNGNRIIAGYKFYKASLGAVNSQMANEHYDGSSFEMLADNFASRFGYGKQIILALDKLERHGVDMSNTSMYVMAHIMTTLLLIAMVASTAAMLSISFPVGFALAIINGLVLYASGDRYHNFTYDDLKDRYKRVRNDYINKIKSYDVPVSDLKEILDTIYTMDEIIDNTYNFKSIMANISNFIFTVNRDTRNSVLEQQMLEKLAFNDLFLKSAELKTLA